ncbi:MAG TPA: hypothetical protein VKX40_00715 [Aequorivita sp.]|nr:hypothetical protein [Aequorivita sp.]
MKKKLREQLNTLAKQLLEEEKTFKTASIKRIVSEIYEKLTVLEYLENQIEESLDTHSEESLDSKSFREENWFTEPEPVPQPDHKDDLAEPLIEKIKDIVAQMPEEGEQVDELLDELLPEEDEPTSPTQSEKPMAKYVKNDLEEFAKNYQRMPEFERKQTELFPPSTGGKEPSKNWSESRAKSLNETVNKSLNIGLNDRLAFIKHLFEGQSEDYTRVLSQINTMDNFEEAKDFIKGRVKPDYNYWTDKEVYSDRFMAIIEKRFN